MHLEHAWKSLDAGRAGAWLFTLSDVCFLFWLGKEPWRPKVCLPGCLIVVSQMQLLCSLVAPAPSKDRLGITATVTFCLIRRPGLIRIICKGVQSDSY